MAMKKMHRNVFMKIIALAILLGWLVGLSVAGPINPLEESVVKSSPELAFSDGQAVSQFLNTNYQSLAKDIAKGRGQFLDAFADLVGVNESEHNTFAVVLQKQFENIYPNMEVKPQEFINRMIQVLSEHNISIKQTHPSP